MPQGASAPDSTPHRTVEEIRDNESGNPTPPQSPLKQQADVLGGEKKKAQGIVTTTVETVVRRHSTLNPAPPVNEPGHTASTPQDFTAENCLERFQLYIQYEKPQLTVFYKDETKLQECSKKAELMIKALLAKGCKPEIAKNLSTLVLYDLVMLLDDSASMREDQKGERIETLQKTMEAITDVYDLANDNGIQSVKFLNSNKGKRSITSRNVGNVLNDHYFHGVTKIGSMLDKRVLKQFVFKSDVKMTKPLLIMIITDGEVEGEKEELLPSIIKNCVDTCRSKPELGEDAVAFHFSRVGNDAGAEELLRKLDEGLGKHVDCLPMEKKLENINGAQKWRVLHKLLLGALMKDVNDDDREHELDGEEGDLDDAEEEEEVDEDVEDMV